MKKRVFCFLVALIMGVSFMSFSLAESEAPMYDPNGGSSTKSFSNAHVQHKYVTLNKITKRSPNDYGSYRWNTSISVSVSSLSTVPTGTQFRITLVDAYGNVVGSYKNWTQAGSKSLTLSAQNDTISKIALELRNTERIGEIVSSGSFTGSYYLDS